jgi:alanine racemase
MNQAIINLNRFTANIKAVKSRIGKNRLICVPVKANGYGHGALEIAKASLEAGAFCLGVATVTEGVELREGGIEAPILLFSQPHPEEISVLIKTRLTPFVSDAWFADALNDQVKNQKPKGLFPVHLKIDTGMGRLGCSADEALALASHIKTCKGLELTGVATHFAVSDSVIAEDIEFTQQQLVRFKEALDAIKSAGIDTGIVHAANSGAVILHNDSWFDMVRPGILLYGYKSVEENQVPGFSLEPLNIKPVMEMRTVVALIKKVKKGETVSYGRTWTAPQNTSIAILSAGYADGFPRLASNQWQMVIGGASYPIVGRICMDQCCVDLGQDSPVRQWDEAVIFGGAAPSAEALAQTTGTIPYEITCNINARVPREYSYHRYAYQRYVFQ